MSFKSLPVRTPRCLALLENPMRSLSRYNCVINGGSVITGEKCSGSVSRVSQVASRPKSNHKKPMLRFQGRPTLRPRDCYEWLSVLVDPLRRN
jgi:hypothetical protein